jgi:hypothetical protein
MREGNGGVACVNEGLFDSSEYRGSLLGIVNGVF